MNTNPASLIRLLTLLWLLNPLWTNAQSPVAIALHGGAGTLTREAITPEQEAAYREILDRAVVQGHASLVAGADGVDVVVEVIRILEDSPLFNAGRGAVFTWQGTHELDAAIMRGDNLNAGAIAGATRVRNPIEAARSVMDDSPHVLLSGPGADQFAAEQNLTLVDNSYFSTERRWQALQSFRDAQGEAPLDRKFGTVGVVVLDQQGNLAAGTSTGGMTGKRWGRIGDSPLIGAGTYASNASCAVSATGHGEYFIRLQVASDICSRVQYQKIYLQAAAGHVIHQALQGLGGTGGVVAVDPRGNVAMVFNTEGMYRASINGLGEKVVGIFGEEGVGGAR